MNKQLKTGEDHSGKKYVKKDFSNQNLQYANFRSATLLECDFSNSDLRYANFTSANCYGSNFTGAILQRVNMMDANLQRTIMKPKDAFGIVLTMKCETFVDMEIDEIWLKVWMFMPAQMKLPELNSKGLNNGDKPWLDKIILFLGEKTYVKYKEIFANRIV